MTRFDAMCKIIDFGKNEEKTLLMKGETHKAHQIE